MADNNHSPQRPDERDAESNSSASEIAMSACTSGHSDRFPTEPLRILIADDNSRLPAMLGPWLLAQGHSVDISRSGATTLAEIRDAHEGGHPYDLLLAHSLHGDENIAASLRLAGLDTEVLPIPSISGMPASFETRYAPPHRTDGSPSLTELLERLESTLGRLLAGRRSPLDLSQDCGLHRASDLADFRLHFQAQTERIARDIASHRERLSLPPTLDGLNYQFRHLPSGQMGGDFLGIHPVADDFEILMASVAGHDFAATYITALIKAFFESNGEFGAHGDPFLRILNAGLLELGTGRTVTATHLRIQPKHSQVTVTSAAFPPPIFQASGCTEPCPKRRFWGDPLGTRSEIALECHCRSFGSGDRLVLHSGGLESLLGLNLATGYQEEMGIQGLMTLLTSHRRRPLGEAIHRTWESSLAFARTDPKEDLLLLGVELPTG